MAQAGSNYEKKTRGKKSRWTVPLKKTQLEVGGKGCLRKCDVLSMPGKILLALHDAQKFSLLCSKVVLYVVFVALQLDICEWRNISPNTICILPLFGTATKMSILFSAYNKCC